LAKSKLMPLGDGDVTHRLPFGHAEPYRLWFEFLKLAYRAGVAVDASKYEGWDDVRSVKFDDWFPSHWRSLFAVERDVVQLRSDEDWQRYKQSSTRITFSFPLDAEIQPTLENVRLALRDARVGLKLRRVKAMSAARYKIGATNLKPEKLRQLLRVYSMWLDAKRDVNATAKRYSVWAKEQNTKRKAWIKRREGAGKPPFWHLVPDAGYETYIKGDPDERRRTIVRYIRKTRAILDNVANGSFPGAFN
jgi:hypothetical protein